MWSVVALPSRSQHAWLELSEFMRAVELLSFYFPLLRDIIIPIFRFWRGAKTAAFKIGELL